MGEDSDFTASEVEFEELDVDFEDCGSESGAIEAGGDVRTRKSTFLSLQSINGLVCSSQGIPRIMVWIPIGET